MELVQFEVVSPDVRRQDQLEETMFKQVFYDGFRDRAFAFDLVGMRVNVLGDSGSVREERLERCLLLYIGTHGFGWNGALMTLRLRSSC